MITVTDTQVRGTMDLFQMDYTYATRHDGTSLQVDVEDTEQGLAFARHLGIAFEPMLAELAGDMVRCTWNTVQVVLD